MKIPNSRVTLRRPLPSIVATTTFLCTSRPHPNNTGCPTVILKYWLADANGKRIATLDGVTLNEDDGKIELANTPAGRAYVNHDYENLKNPVHVMVVAIYDGNPAVYEVMQPVFDVSFKNRVIIFIFMVNNNNFESNSQPRFISRRH